MADRMRRWELDAIGREHLRLREVPVPVPGPHEVLVRVGAVALNHRDGTTIETGRGLPLAFPFTPGSDLAGEVVEAGVGVTGVAAGDRVIATFTPDWVDGLRPGTAREPAHRTLGGFHPGVLAEYVALPGEWVVRAPATLDDVQASTLPCAGLTAWFALTERARVRAGETVLIPATGGVALFGLQIAKASGARVIVSGRAANEARTRALGADHYLDRDRADWIEAVDRLTDGRGADHVLEVIGGSHTAKSVRVAAVGGTICLIGALDGDAFGVPTMPMILKDVTIHGIGTGSRRALERFVRAIDACAIRPVVDAVYPLTALPEALAHLDRGAFGKVVVRIAG